MNRQKRSFSVVGLLALVLLGALLLAGCGARTRVGALQTESQSVELGDAESVRVEIELGTGDLQVTGDAEKLLEADFVYNVAELKPEVVYADGTLVVTHPESTGLPALQGIAGFRNEWDLSFNNDVPLDLRVEMGAGSNDLQLAGLSLTGLDISLGAGSSTVDLSGSWERDLDATIETGAANFTMKLPKDVGVRVEAQAGIGRINAPGLTKDGNIYTNAAYGDSQVTLRISLQAGIGQINLEVE